MHDLPDLMSDRPDEPDDRSDVISDLLEAVQLRTAIYGRLELHAPWQLRIPARPYLSFYVVARGGAWIGLDGEAAAAVEARHPGASGWIALSAGDLVLLPGGSAHRLRDAERSDALPVELDYAACPGPRIGHSHHFGGDGPVTTLVTGHFTFVGSASRNPLLGTLPMLIHLPANAAEVNPQLAGVVPLVLSESARPGPGASLVLARLADLLLVHALRYWIATAGAEQCGLQAVADPAIGKALRLIHARPEEPWTVESLAAAVSMSRSAFGARFTKLVGEPPLTYLTRWRMTRAARLLGREELSVAAVAEQVGYSNTVAFAKAFARFQGVGPGSYRRAQRA